MSAQDQLELKRLGFVRSYTSAFVGYGEGVYRKARSYVPGVAEPYVGQLEDSTTALAAPLIARVQDKAAELLAAVDGKVDGLFGTVASTLEYSRDLHAKNMGSFSAAKESYYSLIEGVVNTTKAALDPQRYVQYAAEIGKSVVDTVIMYADPDKIAALASGVVDKVATQAPVVKVLEIADPFIAKGQTQYIKAHDLLVVQPLYKKLYDTATAIPSKVQDTTFYKRGYPLVAPVADPVYTNFANSKVIKQLDEHLKPKTA